MAFTVPGYHLTIPPGGKEGGNNAQSWWAHWFSVDTANVALGQEFWSFASFMMDADSDWPIFAFCPTFNLHVTGSNPAWAGIASSPIQFDISNGNMKMYIRGAGVFDPNQYGPGFPGYHDVVNIQRPLPGAEPVLNRNVRIDYTIHAKISAGSDGFVQAWYCARDGSMSTAVKICDVITPTMYNSDPGPLSLYYGFYTKGAPAESSGNDGKTFKLSLWLPRMGATPAAAAAHLPVKTSEWGSLNFDPTIVTSIAGLSSDDFIYPVETGLVGGGGGGGGPTSGTVPFADDIAIHIGYDRIGLQQASLSTDIKRGIIATATVTGIIPKVRLYCSGDPTMASGLTQVSKADIYSVVGGVPATKLAESDELVVHGSQAVGLANYVFQSPASVVQGQQYAIVIHSGLASSLTIIYFDSVVGAGHFNSDTYSDGASASWGADSVNDRNISVVAQIVPTSNTTAVFGKTALGGTTFLASGIASDIEVQGPYTLTTNGFVNKLSAMVGGYPAGGVPSHMRMVLYRDNAGVPTSFFAVTNEVTLLSTDAVALRDFFFATGGYTVVNGDKFWLGFWADGNFNTLGDSFTPGAQFNLAQPYSSTLDPPDPWATTGTHGDSGHLYTMYATYIPSGGLVKPSTLSSVTATGTTGTDGGSVTNAELLANTEQQIVAFLDSRNPDFKHYVHVYSTSPLQYIVRETRYDAPAPRTLWWQ